MINCVISRYNKNVDWIYDFNSDNINNIFIYDKETPENLHNISANKGNEATVYLKYIIDNYENLSDFTFFVHDEEYSWHHSGSIIDKYNEALHGESIYIGTVSTCVATDELAAFPGQPYDIFLTLPSVLYVVIHNHISNLRVRVLLQL